MSVDLVTLQARYSNSVYQGLGTDVVLTGSCLGSFNVQQVEYPRQQLARLGLLYCISAGVVANAKAPVTDIGTTTAAWALYNGNTAASGINLYVGKVGVHLASGTSDIGATLWMGMSPTAQSSAVSAATGIVGPKSLSASSARTSLAVLGGAVTLAGAPAWVPIGGLANHAAAATPGSGVVVDLNGGLIIPPLFACGFTVLSGAGTTAKYAVSISEYAEYRTDLV